MNPITGENQHIGIRRDQEVALGLQAAPEMAAQFGGLEPDDHIQSFVRGVGTRVAQNSAAGTADYRYSFHVLRDRETVNAFALLGGPIFITAALFQRLKISYRDRSFRFRSENGNAVQANSSN